MNDRVYLHMILINSMWVYNLVTNIYAKRILTIIVFSETNLKHICTGGSAYETILKGRADVHIVLRFGFNVEYKIVTGSIAANFISEQITPNYSRISCKSFHLYCFSSVPKDWWCHTFFSYFNDTFLMFCDFLKYIFIFY